MTIVFDKNFNYIGTGATLKTLSESDIKELNEIIVFFAENLSSSKKSDEEREKRAKRVFSYNAFFDIDDLYSFVDGFLSAFCRNGTITKEVYTGEQAERFIRAYI